MKEMDNIDALIGKFLLGEASPEEALNLEAWKNQSNDNHAYYKASANTFDLINNNQPLGHIDIDEAWKKNATFLEKKSPSKSGRVRYIYVTLSLLLLMSLFYIFGQTGKQPVKIDATQYALNETLEDGSLTTLEPNSSLELDEGFGVTNRKVKLTGSANFEVEHDEAIPFIIEVEGVFVEDLGTKFKIESAPESDTIYVVVEEGIVRLYDAFGNEIILKAGEKAWYIKSEKNIIVDLDTTVYKFDFREGTTLNEAITLISKAYDVDIILEPQSIESCVFSTKFFEEDVETILSIITQTLDFDFSLRNGSYIIKGRPCLEIE